MEETHGFLAISGIVGFLYHNQAVTSVDLVRKTRDSYGCTLTAILSMVWWEATDSRRNSQGPAADSYL
jgi:hypothetical protein